MPKIIPQTNKTILIKTFISISKAANFLQISPDTLRNWEKAGKLLPARTHGGARRYSMAELMALKKEIHPLATRKKGLVTVSTAAQALQISPDTLRSWERKGLIESSRTKGGARRFTRNEIKRLQDELGVEAEIAVKPPKFEPEVHKTSLSLRDKFSVPWLKITFSTALVMVILSASWFFGSYIGPLEKKTDENSKLIAEIVKSIEELQRGVLGVQTELQPTPSPIAVPAKVDVVYVNPGNNGVAITYAEAPVMLDPLNGRISCPSCLTTSSSYLSSLTNSDGSLGVSFSDKAATISLNLDHTNNWGANQNFKGGIQINDSSANPVVMTSSGNVGIGITTPINKLEVAGGQTIGAGYAGKYTAPANGLLVQGNVGIGTSVTSNPLTVGIDSSTGNGAYLTAGGVWTNGSSRSFKENFMALDDQDILSKINQLDISRWNYKVEGSSVKHIGPVAEDFYSIFGVGNDPQHISTIDPAGIALAGIKAQQKEINDLVVKQSSMSAMLVKLSFDADGTLNIPQIRVSSLILDPYLATASGQLVANDNQLALNTDPNYTSPGPDLASNNTSYIDLSGEIASLEDRIQSQEERIKQLESVIASTAKQSNSVDNPTRIVSSQTPRNDNTGNVGIGTTVFLTPIAISSAVTTEAKNDASSSANLTANDTQVHELTDITTKSSSDSPTLRNTDTLDLTPPDVLLASSSATLTDLKVTNNLSSDKLFAAENSKVSGDLSVFGKTILASTTIAGDLTVDGTLSINGNSINVIGAPDCSKDKGTCGILYLQNSPLAYAVDFFNGLVTIDKTGNLRAQSVTVAEFRVVANKISGSSKISEGSKSADIENPLIKSNSRILITPTSETNLVLAVTEKTEGKKFAVSVAQPADKDIVFDWFLISEVP